MMKTYHVLPPSPRSRGARGFALIATISVMVLLVMIALAMLSLSTISTRNASHEDAQLQAQANARMGLMLALAELQKHAGSDLRVTADGSILGSSVAVPHAVGVWESWSPALARNTKGSAPNYDQEKQSRFLRWLVSGEESELTQRNWPSTTANGQQIDLFGTSHDGFSLQGRLMPTENEQNQGAYAWAVSQENTKAKVSVAGPELADRETNDDLQVQPRPHVGQSGVFSQPNAGWNRRSAQLLNFRQVSLDSSINTGGDAPSVGADFTTSSYGLLTNVVDGGFKVDMSLGFEMSDTDYARDSWSVDGETIANPFRKSSVSDFNVPASYASQRPLYEPITDSGTYSHERAWKRTKDQVHSHFPVTAVPTFDTLRSYYRIPHHLYQSSKGVTVYERQGDHIAAGEGSLSAGYTRPPHIAANGASTQMAVRPLLDRIIYIFSITLSSDNTPQYAITPIITLWNPYNTALEIEGAVAYPWLDIPIHRDYRGTSNGASIKKATYMSRDLTEGPLDAQGRQIEPYIFAAITADGNPITGTAQPIQFEPGEVRVFAPASSTMVDLTARDSTPRQRTIFMKPVDSISDWNLTGGISFTPYENGNADFVMTSGDYVNVTFQCLDDHPICIGLSDTTMAKGSSSPAEGTRSQLITDVLDSSFGTTARDDGTYYVKTPDITYSQLKEEPYPAFTLEVYHRVAQSSGSVQNADLVYTGNPRQSSMNPYVTKTGFQTGPQYKARMRAISSLNDVMEIATSGLNRPAAFYGAGQSSGSGRSHLSFFEIPRAPLLSLAAFQHADLAPSPFAPANQAGNSWASAYVPRDQVIDGNEGLEVDHSYLVNESLWDGYFLSGAAPTLAPGNSGGSSNVWNTPVASATRSLSQVLEDFAADPSANPLRNPRMRLLHQSLHGMTPAEFAAAMTQPEACTQIAEHLMLDGSFNINSTSVKAWVAMLSGLRGASIELGDTSGSTEISDTPFPRFRDPLGSENDIWQGFRSLSDTQIEQLAEQIVEQVRARGPFLSLAEFVNRRVEDSPLGLSGALQSAIDATNINQAALQGTLDDSKYDSSEATNISPKNTGVGIPGYLTQADLLKPLAPIITPRSDTFTIRSYGEARDGSGEVTATAWVEATVQRFPDFVDRSNSADTAIDELSAENQKYGRKFRIVSFRYLAAEEAQSLSQ
ncbi:hypothetical protein JIN77_16550 [Verrucomicrobiaceae bacterium R5-34]|nr:hypothetical protein [Verrucomicrobiaceae bacterium R5-34]